MDLAWIIVHRGVVKRVDRSWAVGKAWLLAHTCLRSKRKRLSMVRAKPESRLCVLELHVAIRPKVERGRDVGAITEVRIR